MMTGDLDLELEDEEGALEGVAATVATTATTASQRDAPAFDFYCERWTHGTRHLTKVERCDYLDLLLHQWTNDGLPADLDLLARLVGYRKGSQISPLVLDKFPVAADGKRRNVRLEHEREKQRDRIRRKRQGAAITNAKREARKAAAAGVSGKAVPSDKRTRRTHSDTDSVTLSERLACAERDDIVTPPPTTHHPPRSNTHTPRAGAREGRDEVTECGDTAVVESQTDTHSEFPTWFPPTVERAIHACAAFAVPKEYVESVWLQLVGREFRDGAGREVTRFAHYVASRWPKEKARWERDQRNNERGNNNGSNNNNENDSRNTRHAGSAPGARSSDNEIRSKRAGEIQTDVHVGKVKIYRLEDCEHE